MLPITINKDTPNGVVCCLKFSSSLSSYSSDSAYLLGEALFEPVGSCWVVHHDFAEFEASRALIQYFITDCDAYGLRPETSFVLTRVFNNIHNLSKTCTRGEM